MNPSLPPEPEEAPHVGLVLGGRYHLVRLLGRGGAGWVYLANQEPLGREVAVKLLRTDLAELDQGQLEGRFMREAAVSSRLRHPNVVTVHDYGEDHGVHYVVMQYLRGQTLGQRLREVGRVGQDEAARLALGIARGLRHAHQEGLIHRDIKPTNVVLEPDDEGVLQPMILDFGLARAEGDRELTRTGAYLGTPAYMAPEQARGEKSLDARVDVYALGCVMYRMLAGVVPYEADTALGQAVKHQTEPYAPIAQRVPGVSVDPGLEAIVRRCMEKSAAARYAHVALVVDALEAWVAQQRAPVDTLAGPPITVVAPRASRAPMVVGVGMAGLGVLAMLFAALAIGGVAWFQFTRPPPEAAIREPGGAEPPSEPDATPVDVAPAEPAAPEPVVAPAPPAEPEPAAPKPVVSAPKPAPTAPSPAPAPKPAPASGGAAVTVDGVAFTADQAARGLTWVNTATEDQIRHAGVFGRQVNVVLGGRPFASLQQFGDTPQIGPQTVQAVLRAVESP